MFGCGETGANATLDKFLRVAPSLEGRGWSYARWFQWRVVAHLAVLPYLATELRTEPVHSMLQPSGRRLRRFVFHGDFWRRKAGNAAWAD